MRNLSRRNFLKNTTLTAAAMAMPASSWAKIAGANNDIRLAVIGFHGRGETHIDAYKKLKGVRLTALCDVDKNVLDRGAAKLKAAGIEAEAFTDIRKLLESKNI